jgi:hypothetical protein
MRYQRTLPGRSNAPQLMKLKKETAQDSRISNCTDCRKGIFKGRDSYVWTRRGLVHQECEDAINNTA